MFRGASSLNMDSKGRLGVPTKYRDPLRERCAGKLVLTVNNTRERCLWLYPYDEWEQVERKVVDLPSFDASAQALKRFLIGYATDCELDSAGRVRVSAPLREFAGLEKRVVIWSSASAAAGDHRDLLEIVFQSAISSSDKCQRTNKLP